MSSCLSESNKRIECENDVLKGEIQKKISHLKMKNVNINALNDVTDIFQNPEHLKPLSTIDKPHYFKKSECAKYENGHFHELLNQYYNRIDYGKQIKSASKMNQQNIQKFSCLFTQLPRETVNFRSAMSNISEKRRCSSLRQFCALHRRQYPSSPKPEYCEYLADEEHRKKGCAPKSFDNSQLFIDRKYSDNLIKRFMHFSVKEQLEIIEQMKQVVKIAEKNLNANVGGGLTFAEPHFTEPLESESFMDFLGSFDNPLEKVAKVDNKVKDFMHIGKTVVNELPEQLDSIGEIKDEMKSKIKNRVDELKEDVTDDIKEKTDILKNKVIKELKDKVTDKVGDLKHKADELKHGLVEQVSDLKDETNELKHGVIEEIDELKDKAKNLKDDAMDIFDLQWNKEEINEPINKIAKTTKKLHSLVDEVSSFFKW